VFGLRALSGQKKPKTLEAYLDRFKREVQRFFPVPAGVVCEVFRDLDEGYPGSELIPV
jgi:hypothetical protein